MPDLTTDDAAPAVVAPAFAPGQVIAGRYRLESRLGAGGGGTVWRALDEKLGSVVALKIVASDVDLERWRREVATARQITDRNVCRVHDLGESALEPGGEAVRYVTMELVEGKPLRSRISPQLPAAEARSLFSQIVSGAAAIHAAGIIHRDLKPENVVVEPGGRAVIVDFGLARVPQTTDEIANHAGATLNMRATTERTSRPRRSKPTSATVTSAGVVVGTPRYMSPEQAVGDTVDERTDVWALGLIGHELFTGDLPALDEDGGRRVGPIAKWPGGAAVLQRCLALLPKDRYADARALAAALGGPKPRARLWIAIAIAAAAALAGTGAVFGVRALVGEEPTRAQPPPPRPVQTFTTLKLTDTDVRTWPRTAPMSVALAPDATRFAYTTPARALVVRALAGGEAKAWTLPVIETPSDKPDRPPRQERLATWSVVGWFTDGSLALRGARRDNEHRLYRVYEDGRHELLFRAARWFPAAVTSRDEVLVAQVGHGIGTAADDGFFARKIVVALGDRVTHLAAAPDGARVAYVRVPPDAREEVSLHLASLDGKADTVIWRAGSPEVLGDALVWLDDHRLAFVEVDGARRSRLVVHDLRRGETAPRTDWMADHLGAASAARGTVLVLQGPASERVHLGDDNAWPLEPLHDADLRGGSLAGWTTDGHLVFALGPPGKQRVVRVSSSRRVEPWPNTSEGGEVPDTVIEGDVVVHRRGGGEIAVERIDATGKRVWTQRLPEMAVPTFVRCAGDRVPPCMIQRIEGTQVTWTELDAATGALGRPLFAHEGIPRVRSGALSSDGKVLVFVDGTATLAAVVDGVKRSLPIRDVETLRSAALGADRALWMASTGLDGRPFGLAKIGWSEKMNHHYSSPRHWADDDTAMRVFERPMPSPDGKAVAVVVRELRLEVTRIDGL